MKPTILLCCLTAAAWLPDNSVQAHDKARDGQPTTDDAALARQFLEKSQPGKKWDQGPTRVDSPEIRQAYPHCRFYYVWSATPEPRIEGIKRVGDDIKERERTMNHISATVRIDARGKVSAMNFGDGLMPVATEADAGIAAAALLSLKHHSDGPQLFAPAVFAAKDVTVVKSDKGFSCTVRLADKRVKFRGTFGGDGVVTFTKDGQVGEVVKRVWLIEPYRGPFPP